MSFIANTTNHCHLHLDISQLWNTISRAFIENFFVLRKEFENDERQKAEDGSTGLPLSNLEFLSGKTDTSINSTNIPQTVYLNFHKISIKEIREIRHFTTI